MQLSEVVLIISSSLFLVIALFGLFMKHINSSKDQKHDHNEVEPFSVPHQQNNTIAPEQLRSIYFFAFNKLEKIEPLNERLCATLNQQPPSASCVRYTIQNLTPENKVQLDVLKLLLSLVPDPRPQLIASSDLVPYPRQQLIASSDLVPYPRQQLIASSDLVPDPRPQLIASSDTPTLIGY